MAVRVKPLVIIPNYATKPEDVETVLDALKSIRKTMSDGVEVLIVDDASPEPALVDEIEEKSSEILESSFHRKAENTGFSKTVNVGLRRALTEGRDAVLMNADVEMDTPGWAKVCRATRDARDNPAAVVGALLLYPNGLIQHAGIYFSLLTRTFDHMYKYGPGNLPDALKMRIAPVTGAFQYIRHECLTDVGLYDEGFHMGYEDVDYCVRVFLSGGQCVFNPKVRGWHHEMMFRGRPGDKLARWHDESLARLADKYRNQSFADFVPYW